MSWRPTRIFLSVVRVGDRHGSNPNLNPNHNYRKRTAYYKIKTKSVDNVDDVFVHGSTQRVPSSTSGSREESRVFPAANAATTERRRTTVDRIEGTSDAIEPPDRPCRCLHAASKVCLHRCLCARQPGRPRHGLHLCTRPDAPTLPAGLRRRAVAEMSSRAHATVVEVTDEGRHRRRVDLGPATAFTWIRTPLSQQPLRGSGHHCRSCHLAGWPRRH